MGRITLVALFAAIVASAQQPNSDAASLVIGGVDGGDDPIYPLEARLLKPPGSTVRIEVRGAPWQPVLIGRAPAGLAAVSLETSHGLMDLDVFDGFDVVAEGMTDAEGLWVREVTVELDRATDLGAFQALVGDPAGVGGYTLSAATHVTVAPEWREAYYVSSLRGKQDSKGTRDEPFLTIGEALRAATAGGEPFAKVFVAEGDYRESPTFPAGVDVHGGFDPVTWRLVPSHRSRVWVGTVPAFAADIQEETRLTGMSFRAADVSSSGQESVALVVINCTDALSVERCDMRSARGGVGRGGEQGTAGRGGEPGLSGDAGGTPAQGGGRGGNGGHLGSGMGGQQATDGGAPGGAGGSGGPCNRITLGSCGAPGAQGRWGRSGAHGTRALAGEGVTQDGLLVPPPPGGSGREGGRARSGGGGGGGGGTTSVGGVCTGRPGGCGGGGGSGGFPGMGAAGGHAGGPSIGLWCHDAAAVFLDCLIQSREGGRGGVGGAGGPGGAGGFGGAGGSLGGAPGGGGGGGGTGGGGGGGGGGAGGSSLCVLVSGSRAPRIDPSCVLVPGLGGAGGLGGLHGDGGDRAEQGERGHDERVRRTTNTEG